MKKILLVLTALAMFSGACQPGAGSAPTPLPFVTALPTPTSVTLNPTAAPSGRTFDAGEERTANVDGMIMVYIPAGSFRMGGLDADRKVQETPDRSVTMKDFWIDKIEVTVGMYALCVQAGACEPPRDFTSESRTRYFGNPEFNDYPVIHVTWGDAKAYCEWAGRRLPTEAEWERAARGDDFRIFPWGDERPDASRANFNWLVRDTSRVGSFPAGASPFGVLDMAGNVWEWVEDYYNPTFYSSAGSQNPLGPLAPAGAGHRRVLRGGSWQDDEKEIRVSNRGFASGPDFSAAVNSPAYFGEAARKIGFRCATDN
jgi:eukaryotic-like serine/threonine-protein kinase